MSPFWWTFHHFSGCTWSQNDKLPLQIVMKISSFFFQCLLDVQTQLEYQYPVLCCYSDCYFDIFFIVLYIYNSGSGVKWAECLFIIGTMITFFALLALCAGNSPVNDEFPAQRPVTRSFDVFFDIRLNKQLSKQSRRGWFETSWRSLWCHCNDGLLN